MQCIKFEYLLIQSSSNSIKHTAYHFKSFMTVSTTHAKNSQHIYA